MNTYDYVFTSKVEANIIENDLTEKNRLVVRVSPYIIREINVNDNDIINLQGYQKEMRIKFVAINHSNNIQRGLYE